MLWFVFPAGECSCTVYMHTWGISVDERKKCWRRAHHQHQQVRFYLLMMYTHSHVREVQYSLQFACSGQFNSPKTYKIFSQMNWRLQVLETDIVIYSTCRWSELSWLTFPIVIFCSMSGHRVVPSADIHFYSSTKYAVTALTEGLRQELREANTHIRATVRLYKHIYKRTFIYLTIIRRVLHSVSWSFLICDDAFLFAEYFSGSRWDRICSAALQRQCW